MGLLEGTEQNKQAELDRLQELLSQPLTRQLVMFWEACSRVVDHRAVDVWLAEHFKGKWDNGSRNATTNASNFHHCIQAVREANKKPPFPLDCVVGISSYTPERA